MEWQILCDHDELLTAFSCCCLFVCCCVGFVDSRAKSARTETEAGKDLDLQIDRGTEAGVAAAEIEAKIVAKTALAGQVEAEIGTRIEKRTGTGVGIETTETTRANGGNTEALADGRGVAHTAADEVTVGIGAHLIAEETEGVTVAGPRIAVHHRKRQMTMRQPYHR